MTYVLILQILVGAWWEGDGNWVTNPPILKQKIVPLLNSDECKNHTDLAITESVQDWMCIRGDNSRKTF